MRGRTAIRLAAALFALVALGAFTVFEADVRSLAGFAAAAEHADGGVPATDAQRLPRFVAYARAHVVKPRLQDLHPWPVRLYYQANPMHPGPGDVLRWGADYRGGCGSLSRVVHAMLESRHIRTRILLLTDAHQRSLHTVLESRVDGRWAVSDPLYGIVFHRRDGSLATRQDLASDHAWFHAQVDTVAGYDARYDYQHTTLLNWYKVPVVLPALRALLSAAFGPARVDAFERPDLWMWPQAALAIVSALLALACAFAARRRVPGEHATGRLPEPQRVRPATNRA